MPKEVKDLIDFGEDEDTQQTVDEDEVSVNSLEIVGLAGLLNVNGDDGNVGQMAEKENEKNEGRKEPPNSIANASFETAASLGDISSDNVWLDTLYSARQTASPAAVNFAKDNNGIGTSSQFIRNDGNANSQGSASSNTEKANPFFMSNKKQSAKEAGQKFDEWPRAMLPNLQQQMPRQTDKFDDGGTEMAQDEGTSRQTAPEAYATAAKAKKKSSTTFAAFSTRKPNQEGPRKDEEQPKEMDKRMVGIDLGTTNSLVALLMNNGKVEVLASSDGTKSFLTPSYVHYHPETDKILVGNAAKAKMFDKSRNTIFDVKRMFGKKVNDLDVKKWEEIVGLPIRQIGDQPLIEVQHNREKLLLRPQDVSAQVLVKLRQTAEQLIQTRSAAKKLCLTKAVITVPAKFEMPEKLATMEAAKIAGFTDVRLITEPAAAGYSYGYHEQKRDGYTMIVFDFGGGTFDVVVMRVENRAFRVIKMDGNRSLGGRNFDAILTKHLAQLIRRRFGYDLEGSAYSQRKLLELCVALKEHLSSVYESSIFLNDFGLDEELQFTRDELEELIMPGITETVNLTERVLTNANMQMEEIDEILLVGGSSRIPLIRKKLVERGFPEDKFNVSADPDLAMVKGAAVLAAQISGVYEGLPRMALIEAIPLSIGLAMEDGTFNVLIPRNSPIPFAERQFTYYTVINDQYSAIFEFFEGERQLATKNRPLGSLFIDDLTPGRTGHVGVNLWIGIDNNGLLSARAEHAGRTVQMELSSADWMNGLEAIDDQAIADALEQARLFGDSDREELAREQARSELMVAIEKAQFEPNKAVHYADFRQWYFANASAATTEQFKAKLAELRN